MPRHVTLIGATLWGNRGAEAMLTTSIGVLRRRWPDARFTILSYYPQQDRALLEQNTVEVLDARQTALVFSHLPFALICRCARYLRLSLPRRLIPAPVQALLDSDILLDLGGISFVDGREIFLPFDILCIWPAMLLCVPIVKVSQAMGPFNGLLNRLAAKLFLARCEYIIARGSKTAQHLRELGLPDVKYSVAPDVAFGYQPEFSLTSENGAKVANLLARLEERKRAKHMIVGFCPSMVVRRIFSDMGRDYLSFAEEVVKRLIGKGCLLVVTPNATREGTKKWKNNDLIVIAQLHRRLEVNLAAQELSSIEWVDFDVNTRSITSFTGLADAFITSRFHCMIAALSGATPVLVVDWSHKYREVLEIFGLEHFAVDCSATTDQVCALVDELIENRQTIRRKIIESLPQVRKVALEQFDRVAQFVR